VIASERDRPFMTPLPQETVTDDDEADFNVDLPVNRMPVLMPCLRTAKQTEADPL
jgi:hypothetical protein